MSSERPATRSGSAFALPAFRRLWLAGTVSEAGDWLLFIALPLLVLRLTGSAFGTALAFLLEIAPAVLLSPVAGRIVDAVPRRTLLVVVSVAQAAAITPLLVVRTTEHLPVVYGVIVAQSALAALSEPAKNALLPALVGPERILSAYGLVGLSGDLGRLVGGPVGGVLFAVGGSDVVVVVDVGTYLVAAVLVATLRPGPVAPLVSDAREAERPMRRTGLAAVLRRPAIRAQLVVVLTAAVAQGMFVVLFVLFVTDVLHGGDGDVGLLRGLQAVGAIAAGAALGTGRVSSGPFRLVVVGTTAFAALTLVTWNLSFLTHAIGPYAVLFATVGAPAVLMSSGLASGLQAASTEADRGTVFAALGLAQGAGQGVGLLLAGSMQAVVGTRPLLEVQAGTYVVAAVLALVLLPAQRPAAAPA